MTFAALIRAWQLAALPPRQRSASFGTEQVMQKLRKDGTGLDCLLTPPPSGYDALHPSITRPGAGGAAEAAGLQLPAGPVGYFFSAS
jgi:hypothetical protein